jgi:hypothetical protein
MGGDEWGGDGGGGIHGKDEPKREKGRMPEREKDGGGGK